MYERDDFHNFDISGFACIGVVVSRDILVEMIVGMNFGFYLYTYDSRDISVETL